MQERKLKLLILFNHFVSYVSSGNWKIIDLLFVFSFYMFHVEMKLGGKLFGGAQEKERWEGKKSQSAK